MSVTAVISSAGCDRDHVTLKNGVAIFDGVTIEDDVFVGAGVSLSMTGIPAAIVRTPGLWRKL